VALAEVPFGRAEAARTGPDARTIRVIRIAVFFTAPDSSPGIYQTLPEKTSRPRQEGPSLSMFRHFPEVWRRAAPPQF
jgi:hypothetical protein